MSKTISAKTGQPIMERLQMVKQDPEVVNAAKRAYAHNPKLQKEFGSFGAYLSYRAASSLNLIREKGAGVNSTLEQVKERSAAGSGS